MYRAILIPLYINGDGGTIHLAFNRAERQWLPPDQLSAAAAMETTSIRSGIAGYLHEHFCMTCRLRKH